jgi:hypothetical protein
MTNHEADAGSMLTVVVNGEALIEYDRRKPLAAHQRLYIDRMDRDMDNGFHQDGQHRASPDPLARARFTATSLVQALEAGNDGLAAATCAYLALRLPGLKQVRAQTKQGQTHIDLVFDKPHVPAKTVQFTRPGGANGLH